MKPNVSTGDRQVPRCVSCGTLAYYRLRPQSQIDSIAVLPFADAANDPNLDYQADGLTEELINSLTQAPNLKVMARATVFRYKRRALDPQEVGKELGVRAVLMGRVVRNGNRASVQADLVDTKEGSQLWGRQYNRTLAELQTIQEEIVQQVVSKLMRSGADRKRLAKRHTVNSQAYDLYLQGRRALSELTPWNGSAKAWCTSSRRSHATPITQQRMLAWPIPTVTWGSWKWRPRRT